MSVSMIPYGLLPNGNMGINIDQITRKPNAAAVEIMNSLPTPNDTDNFVGRTVFNTSDGIIHVFSDTPTNHWTGLGGVPARVGNSGGNPPVVPAPSNGEIYYDRDNKVIYVWDGSAWLPIGGKYATKVFENVYIGDGSTSNYPTGANSILDPQYIEVFIDGVRQTTNTDFTLTGTQLTFLAAPANGTRIVIRALEGQEVSTNAQINKVKYVSIAGQREFNTGLSNSSPDGVFVFVDGVLRNDYVIKQQDNGITSITVVGPDTIKVTTNAPHGFVAGSVVTMYGYDQEALDNKFYDVVGVDDPLSFRIVLPANSPTSFTGVSPFYTPSLTPDSIVFDNGLDANKNVEIRVLKSIVVSDTGGEKNVLTDTGLGVGLSNGKDGVALKLKSLKAGAFVNITDNGDDLLLSVSAGASFQSRVGINDSYYKVANDIAYVGVRNASAPVSIDLSGIPSDPTNSGRTLTIKDESGSAGVNNIIISPNNSTIDGQSQYKIENSYGAVTLVFDGYAWFITNKV